MNKKKNAPIPERSELPAEAQPAYQRAVPADVFPAQVVEEPAALAHEFEQSSAAGLVVLVPAEVLSQFVYSGGKNSNLDFRGPCVSWVVSVLLNYGGACGLVQGVRNSPYQSTTGASKGVLYPAQPDSSMRSFVFRNSNDTTTTVLSRFAGRCAKPTGVRGAQLTGFESPRKLEAALRRHVKRC